MSLAFPRLLPLLLTSVLAAPPLSAGEPAPPSFEPIDGVGPLPAPAVRPPEMDAFVEQVMAAGAPDASPAAPVLGAAAPGAGEPAGAPGTEASPGSTAGAAFEALPTGRRYAFGRSVPTLRCLPFRACDLELEAGEKVDGLVVGDPERWETTFLSEGEGTLTPHVLLKPSAFGLRTNLVLVTSRRTYHLELISPAEAEVGKGGREGAPYDAHVSFSYPDAWVRRVRSEAERKAAPAVPEASPGEVALDPARLDFGYELRAPRARRRRLAWAPVTVFSDGTRTFLRLPAAARAGDLPVLLGLLPGGKTYPLNARLEGDWYVVPAVFAEAELVSGTGKARRSLRIVHRGGMGGR